MHRDALANRSLVGPTPVPMLLQPARHALASDATEHSGVRHAVPTQAVRAVHAAGILARREQAFQNGAAIGLEYHAAHHVVRGRYHLDQATGQIEAAVRATLDHALELLAHFLGAEMVHLDIDSAVGRSAARTHFGINGTGDDIARGAFLTCIVMLHETFAGLIATVVAAVEQIAAGATQAFLDHGAGHARARAGEQTGRMELHHLHVAQRQAGAQRHREAIATLVTGRRMVFVHGRAATGRQQHSARLDEYEFAAAHIDHQHAGDRTPIRGSNQLDGAVLLETIDAARPNLLGQPIDDLDAGQIALVHGPVEGLPRERLLMHRAVRVAIEEAAQLVFQLVDALDSARYQRPREVLIR